MRLGRTYGAIFRLALPGGSIVFVSSQELVDELCNEERFDKKVHRGLTEIRDFQGDGLFTAHTNEPNWAKAHRILMPAFGPIGLRDMFDQMLDIGDQMLLRWERFGENAIIDVPDNMTRLTLDTLALCAFEYRFNSFYQNEMHPLVGALIGGLTEALARAKRPDVATRIMLLSNRRYEADVRLMHETADRLIAERKRDPNASSKKDLLNRMLQTHDPVTGEGLSDENIRYQLVTFLIAGHETTSGLLSFTLYFLLRNPRVLSAARSVVDQVLGNEMPRVEHLPKLRYVEQVLMESLRVWPTAPAFALRPYQDTTIGGRYPVTTEDTLMVLLPMLHRDPTVWGTDVEAFRPERFDPEAEAKLPPNAWKPFGNGQRACIGRPFAMQEALLVLSMILQRFDLIADDPAYELRIKETLTLKPDGFRIRAKLRGAVSFRFRNAVPAAAQMPLQRAAAPISSGGDGPLTPLLVLYGSNTGSAESFAQRIGSDALAQRYAVDVAPMDEYAGRLPKEGAIVVVTATYEGQPPDNARLFVAALEAAKPGSLAGTRFCVFGCGNRQWARTYQVTPTKVDGALESAGAARIKPRGEADASGDFFGGFDAWYETLWRDLGEVFGKQAVATLPGPQIDVEVLRAGRTVILREDDLGAGQVVENRELVNMDSPLARSKRHFEILLPEGVSYRAGDYLAVLPTNPLVNVDRALRRFGFAADTQVVLHRGQGNLTAIPTGYPITMSELLSCYVELGQPATLNQVRMLAEATPSPPERESLEALAQEETYRHEVLEKRVSVLDLLERFPACDASFALFLQMLPSLKARQYSISSSPLWNDRRCSLTIAVVDAPALSGQGRYLGVASNYLGAATPGTRISVAVRPSNRRFHPPADPQTPMIMICAGTGFAPFRGFIQERAEQAQAGRSVGRALLFFGCDHPDVDYLYRHELAGWQSAGIVEVRPAFSHAPDGEVKFVQDRIWQDRTEAAELFRQGAIVYVCGDGRRMAPAVRDTLLAIYRETTGASGDVAQRWADEVEHERGRFVEDLFA
jgi:cytochrome P450/NADPH-cytochrome P450 reductase